MTATSAPIARDGALGWMRKNLFKNWWSGVLTVILLGITGFVVYQFTIFLFVTGEWDAVRVNLTLFMLGTFPRVEPNNEMWRLIVQMVIFGLAFGVGAGTSAASRKDRSEDAGLQYEQGSVLDTIKRMWSLVVFIALLLFFASSDTVGTLWGPFAVVGGAVVAGAAGYQAKRFPRRFRRLGWLLTLVLLILGFQVVSGFEAGGWIPLGAVFGFAVYGAVPTYRFETGWQRAGVRLGSAGVVVGILYAVYQFVDLPGVGWDDWSGLHLTLMVSALAIVLAFPLGLLLALARRSTFPALRTMATLYIETVRGVPLITLLFMGQFIIGFLLPPGASALSDITKALAVMTFFTAAYIAEIVRGGLQALDRGQNEAGQALGLAPPTIMRRIILPQALTAVIPAIVGQFISLFKDSSLLSIIAVLEFLGVRKIVHAQADFRGVGIAETLIFVAIGYWAFSFAMSRESQRLERRLRVTR